MVHAVRHGAPARQHNAVSRPDDSRRGQKKRQLRVAATASSALETERRFPAAVVNDDDLFITFLS